MQIHAELQAAIHEMTHQSDSGFLLRLIRIAPVVPMLSRADNRGICQKVFRNPNRT